ncbi:hypothetical protein P0082_09920 [Candidatus Haliotispira prima]|uniref:DZANK-type domain-containing protein n=1 Tax=Candidatus Haliotispira prima TaxID=3034016 RepID=A0ABY8MFT2_9SPIO|nr:hypothetical protein P0082_09920 [Candidatus Haliotispira prima]
MKRQAPSFLCNSCGTETTSDVDSCPSCGALFGNLVHCSQCHHEAKEHKFFDGCPKCGYMSSKKSRRGLGRRKKAATELQEELPQSSFNPLVFALTMAFFLLLLLALLRIYNGPL